MFPLYYYMNLIKLIKYGKYGNYDDIFYWRCSIKKAVLKNFVISTGKQLCWSLFMIKLQACIFIEIKTLVFSFAC